MNKKMFGYSFLSGLKVYTWDNKNFTVLGWDDKEYEINVQDVVFF